MPKFKRRRHGARQDRQKVLEQRRIRLQIRRKLKQHRSQLARGGQWLNGRQKSRHKIFRALEPLDMRDDLMRLDAETKMRGRILQPVLDGRLFDKLPEGKIHFDRIESVGVVIQKFFLRQLDGVKIRLPTRVSPSRRSGVDLWHNVRSAPRSTADKSEPVETGIIPCEPSPAPVSWSRLFLECLPRPLRLLVG